VAIATAWFSVYPAALERLTTFDEGGTGRTELWGVAWEMARDNPITGVGLNNFVVESKEYVRQPGSLEFVELIAERPRVAHNIYLQLLAETGFVGLALFLVLLASCLRAASRAAKGFDARGDPELAALSRAVLVAVLAAAGASTFISNGTDWRLWVLLGLGPALLAASRAAPAGRTVRS
jgi:O-antigen ligase